MRYVLGIDTSTTATKAVLVDDSGRVAVAATSEYGFETPRPLWAEQDPDLWWEATCTSIRSVLSISGVAGSEIAGIGLTGQMHGAVLLDAAGDVLRPAMLWNDQRTGEECDVIRAALGDRLVPITGNDALTGFTAPKLVWVRDHEPEIWQQTRHVLLPKDYVRFRLTGDFATDASDGGGTLLFDLAERTWSAEVLDALGIERSWMPDVYEGSHVTGQIGSVAAELTGLVGGTPVVAGGGDQAANAVGVGVIDPGTMALSVGTSGVIFAPTDTPIYEQSGRVHAFCHAVPDRWHLMGVMLSAAGSLRWLRDVLAPDREFADLIESADQVEAALDGLFFLPYLSGERTPHPDPLARGAFVGLTVRHDLRHMTRAVLEGVAFGLRDNLDLMVEVGLSIPRDIRASGGGTKSVLWRQIIADTLESDLSMADTSEGAAFGAALLAMVGIGWFDTASEAAGQVVTVDRSATPGSRSADMVAAHRQYRDLYPALAPSFHRATSG